MSIIKSILHKYNATSKAYDTLHPETESAQITDWNQGIVNTLASKVLPAVVSELTTDSVMGKLMKMLLNASGVKYLIDTNGYICFGSFFGGLIIQWGYAVSETSPTTIALPISAMPLAVCIVDTNGDNYGLILNTYNYVTGKFDASGLRLNNSKAVYGHYIAICK